MKVFTLILFLSISTNAFADSRMVSGMVPARQIKGLDSNRNPVIGSKSIGWTFKDNDGWKMQCGRYIMRDLIDRLGRYDGVEQARILGNINQIVIVEPKGGLLGSPDPHIQYNAKKRRLTVEFTRKDSKSGEDYCRMSATREAWAMYERWSGRRDKVNLGFSVDLSSERDPSIDHAALDAATQDEMTKRMNKVLVPLPGTEPKPDPVPAPAPVTEPAAVTDPVPAPVPAPESESTAVAERQDKPVEAQPAPAPVEPELPQVSAFGLAPGENAGRAE